MTGLPDDELPVGWDAIGRADAEALAPPPGAKDRVRTELIATLGLAAGLGAAGAASSAAAAGPGAAAGGGAAAGVGAAPATVLGAAKALLLPKLLLGVVAVTAVTGGTVAYVEVRARQEARARAKVFAPVPVPAAATPVAEPIGVPAVSSPVAETLGNERALLDQARDAIARGRLAEAQALLERHAAMFVDGTLTEEREALQIRLLVRQGRSAEAGRSAVHFRQQHPHSIQLPVIDEALRSHR